MKHDFAFRRCLLEPRLATVSFPSILHSNNTELIRQFLVLFHAVLFLLHFHALLFAFHLGKPSLILFSSHSHSLILKTTLNRYTRKSGILFLLASLFQSLLPSVTEGRSTSASVLFLPLPISCARFSVAPTVLHYDYLFADLSSLEASQEKELSLIPLAPESCNMPNPCLPS